MQLHNLHIYRRKVAKRKEIIEIVIVILFLLAAMAMGGMTKPY